MATTSVTTSGGAVGGGITPVALILHSNTIFVRTVTTPPSFKIGA